MAVRASGLAAAMATLILLTACSSAGPLLTPTSPAGSSPNPSAATAPASAPTGLGSGEELCAAIPAQLAETALGQPVGSVSGGDVVPRPNGVYCVFRAAADPGVALEVQIKETDRAAFEASVARLGMSEPVPGAGEFAVGKDGSIMGNPGVAIGAWAAGRGVTLSLDATGDPEAKLAAVIAIANAALAF